MIPEGKEQSRTRAVTKGLLLWLAATIGAAILGGFVTNAYSNARPELTLVSIMPSLAANKGFVNDKTEMASPESMANLCRQTLWCDDQVYRGASIKYEQLVSNLNFNEQNLKVYLRLVKRFSEDYPQMRRLLEQGSNLSLEGKEDFFDLWERNDEFIIGTIRGSFERGGLEVKPKAYSGTPVFIKTIDEPEEENKRSTYYVRKRGARYASGWTPETKRREVLAAQIFDALAYFDTELLSKYLQIAKDDTPFDNVANRVLEEVEKLRSHYSRWAVTFIVANNGGKSIAVLPFAQMEIDTAGLVHQGSELDGVTSINLELRNEASEPVPVHVPGDSAVQVSFSSKDFIIDSPRGDVLLKAYQLGASKARIHLFLVGGGMMTPREMRSVWIPFGPASARTQGKIGEKDDRDEKE